MSFGDELAHEAPTRAAGFTVAALRDLDQTARYAGGLLRADEVDATVARCVESVPGLVAEVLRLRRCLDERKGFDDAHR